MWHKNDFYPKRPKLVFTSWSFKWSQTVSHHWLLSSSSNWSRHATVISPFFLSASKKLKALVSLIIIYFDMSHAVRHQHLCMCRWEMVMKYNSWSWNRVCSQYTRRFTTEHTTDVKLSVEIGCLMYWSLGQHIEIVWGK